MGTSSCLLQMLGSGKDRVSTVPPSCNPYTNVAQYTGTFDEPCGGNHAATYVRRQNSTAP